MFPERLGVLGEVVQDARTLNVLPQAYEHTCAYGIHVRVPSPIAARYAVEHTARKTQESRHKVAIDHSRPR